MASRHAKIWKALKDHLEDYPGLPANVVYDGQPFDDPSPTLPYMIVDDVRFDPSRLYWEGVEWHTGSLAVHCMVPLKWDDVQSAEFAGALCDYFTPDAVMEYDGVSVRVAKQPAVSGAGYRDGSHFRLPCLVYWEGWG